MAHVGRDLFRNHMKITGKMVYQQKAFVWEKPHSALVFSQLSREMLLSILSERFFCDCRCYHRPPLWHATVCMWVLFPQVG